MLLPWGRVSQGAAPTKRMVAGSEGQAYREGPGWALRPKESMVPACSARMHPAAAAAAEATAARAHAHAVTASGLHADRTAAGATVRSVVRVQLASDGKNWSATCALKRHSLELHSCSGGWSVPGWCVCARARMPASAARWSKLAVSSTESRCPMRCACGKGQWACLRVCMSACAAGVRRCRPQGGGGGRAT